MKIGYKATKDLTCRDLTYEVGKTYEISSVAMCGRGFHYCKRIEDTLRYYDMCEDLTFIEIEDLGDSIEKGNKTVTNKMKVLRIIPKDELGWLTKPIRFEDPNGYWYEYEYDDNGNVIRTEDSDGYWDTNEYDTNGNVIKNVRSNGYWHTNEYDTNGNVIRHERYDSLVCTYWITKEYDDNGNEIRFENSNGVWYTKEYNENGSLIKNEGSNGLNWEIKIS